jgi:hypothetical protein
MEEVFKVFVFLPHLKLREFPFRNLNLIELNIGLMRSSKFEATHKF